LIISNAKEINEIIHRFAFLHFDREKPSVEFCFIISFLQTERKNANKSFSELVLKKKRREEREVNEFVLN
jgi:hypothetical protein